MAETEGCIGFGIKVGHAASSSGPFTPILEITDVAGPDIAVDDVEMTHAESPDKYKEFLPGLIDAGEVTFDCNYEKANCAAVYGLIAVKKHFQMMLPDNGTASGSTWVFPGYIKGFAEEEPIDDRILNKVTIKVAGKPVFTAAT